MIWRYQNHHLCTHSLKLHTQTPLSFCYLNCPVQLVRSLHHHPDFPQMTLNTCANWMPMLISIFYFYHCIFVLYLILLIPVVCYHVVLQILLHINLQCVNILAIVLISVLTTYNICLSNNIPDSRIAEFFHRPWTKAPLTSKKYGSHIES